jgi:hypothetical protein
MRKPALIAIAVSLGIGLIYSQIVGCTSYTPHPSPPKEATNVQFLEYSAWQSWNYVYKFDAPQLVCQRFAIDLMKRQRRNCTITTNQFTKFPLGMRDFPSWFDVATVKNGVLFSADNWFYAVVDLERGRLYYYNGN